MPTDPSGPARHLWQPLAAWPGVELIRRLAGGHRNEVMLGSRGSELLVARRSGRPVEAVEWELDLLAHLRLAGVGVPDVVPAGDGRRHVDGVVVSRFVEGGPPKDRADWHRVVETLRLVHEHTVGRPQRPGFASSLALMSRDRGGDVALDEMPPTAAAAVRASWQPVQSGLPCVVHGDVAPGNILMRDGHVTLIDWDEARVDVPWFDFAFVPGEAEAPVPVAAGGRAAALLAGIAWETATCWRAEPQYARRRLTELYRKRSAARREAG